MFTKQPMNPVNALFTCSKWRFDPPLYQRTHATFLLDYLQKSYKRIIKIRPKPPYRRHIATPTKLIKG
jgi:hypothetical protein